MVEEINFYFLLIYSVPIKVTLKELYDGIPKNIKIERSLFFPRVV
jgi:hypothetical protein